MNEEQPRATTIMKQYIPTTNLSANNIWQLQLQAQLLSLAQMVSEAFCFIFLFFYITSNRTYTHKYIHNNFCWFL